MNALVRRSDTWVEPVLPEETIRALKTIREDYPDAFLAGGYLRDLYMGREPRDIDIFTFDIPKEDEKDNGVDKSEHYGVKRIVFVSNRHLPGVEENVQVIFLNDQAIVEEQPNLTPLDKVATAVGQFTFGLQQIFYDGDRIYVTDAFKKDVLNSTLTVMYCEGEDEASTILYKYLYSLKERYPEHRLTIPPQFETLFVHPANVWGIKL